MFFYALYSLALRGKTDVFVHLINGVDGFLF